MINKRQKKKNRKKQPLSEVMLQWRKTRFEWQQKEREIKWENYWIKN